MSSTIFIIYTYLALKMSDIWKYYDKQGDTAKCSICKNDISRKDGSTKGLWKHLESKHKNEHENLKRKSGQNTKVKMDGWLQNYNYYTFVL